MSRWRKPDPGPFGKSALRGEHKDPRPNESPCPGLLPSESSGQRRAGCRYLVRAEEAWSAHYHGDEARCPPGCAAYAHRPPSPLPSFASTSASERLRRLPLT
jgi:hypothetical protein